jgi:hypothetical protein
MRDVNAKGMPGPSDHYPAGPNKPRKIEIGKGQKVSHVF